MAFTYVYHGDHLWYYGSHVVVVYICIVVVNYTFYGIYIYVYHGDHLWYYGSHVVCMTTTHMNDMIRSP